MNSIHEDRRERPRVCSRRQARLRVFKFGLFAVVLGTIAFTQSAAAQTLRNAVEGAWALDPQIKTLEARRSEFIARQDAAGAFFPAPPAITLSHSTDQMIQNNHQRSTELELSTPLWLPGEGTATEQVAQAELSRTDTQLALARLTVAGAVRGAVYKYAIAQREAEIAGRWVQTARSLAADVARRVRAGDAAAVDQDLAEGELATAQANARDRQAQVAAERIALLSLSGLATPPRTSAEQLAPESDIRRHPRLQVAERVIDVARAKLRLAGIATRDSPELGVFAARNRDTFNTQYDTILGLRLRIPFASEGRNAPRRAAALAEATAAQAEYAAAEREVRAELATAQGGLAATMAQAPLVERRLQAERSALGRLQRSYNAGEIGFSDVLRARAALFDAEIAESTNRIKVQQARSRINQALGVVP